MSGENDSIQIVRVFEAPATLVYEQWTKPEHLEKWFAPDGYTCTHSEADARVGGAWRVDYRSQRGESHTESGKFIELQPPERLVLTLTQRDGHGNQGPETRVTVTMRSLGEKTEMTFLQTGYSDAKQRQGNAEGWKECFRKLDANLRSPEHELRALFEDWFRASESKDLDASMRPIAPTVLSYEHESPLQVRGLEAMWANCKRGLDAATGSFRWDIPDLQILVRGDIAVTWGLNRMRSADADQVTESWSRGTRVFQKLDGKWQLIHQHVSFPYDPETGKAQTELKPD